MSDRPLPDDPREWPNNPYQLLGVPHGSSERELKSAYARLIRIYKPELFPEQFRRIRAAYEQALQWVNHWANAADDDADGPSAIVEPVAPLVPVKDELDELWQRAIASETEAAYHGLERLTAPGPSAGRATLRLYWLLTLQPELDGKRAAADWLADHLRLVGASGPALALYETELSLRAGATLTDGFNRLFRGATGSRALLALAGPRWQELIQRGDWQTVREDLRELRQRVKPTDPTTWMQLIFHAAGLLAWDQEHRPAYDLCLREAEDHEYLSRDLKSEYDRFDYLRRLANGCRKAQGQPAELLRFIELSWSRPFPDVRGLLDGILSAIESDPMTWLRHLDRLASIAPLALHWFAQLLQTRTEELRSADGPGPDELKRLVRQALAGNGSGSYRRARRGLLTLCLLEGLCPMAVAAAIAGLMTKSNGRLVTLTEAMEDDYPVCLIGRAVLLARS